MINPDKSQDITHKLFILASRSVYRKQQLQQLGVDFSQVSANIDESLLSDELPADRALRLAQNKAHHVIKQYPHAMVIGSDQVCACGDVIYRKPKNRQKNIQQLKNFSGQQLIFYTALSVIGHHDFIQNHVNQTRVQFRDLSESEIIRYVDKEQAYDCAGGFKMEQMGLSLMTSVHSDDPSALMGLPLIQLCAFLRELGVEIP
jgi:septum formation protein